MTEIAAAAGAHLNNSYITDLECTWKHLENEEQTPVCISFNYFR